MSHNPGSATLRAVHGVLACGTGMGVSVCAALLLCDRPSNFFDALRWMDDTATYYTVLLLTAIASVWAWVYLDRKSLLRLRTRIVLVAAVPGTVVAIWVAGAISLVLHPVGF